MRHLLTASACVASSLVLVAEQGPSGDSKLFSQLKGAFPAATSFSAKEGSPPHFKAYVSDPQGKQTLAGFAFWTTELEPLERGYDGPIKMMVGLDVSGVITGVVVVEHREPYGNFSVEPPEFAAQFRNKRIRDPFKVGGDIDAVSRATITITSATRAIRNSSRRMARQYLSPEAVK